MVKMKRVNRQKSKPEHQICNGYKAVSISHIKLMEAYNLRIPEDTAEEKQTYICLWQSISWNGKGINMVKSTGQGCLRRIQRSWKQWWVSAETWNSSDETEKRNLCDRKDDMRKWHHRQSSRPVRTMGAMSSAIADVTLRVFVFETTQSGSFSLQTTQRSWAFLQIGAD